MAPETEKKTGSFLLRVALAQVNCTVGDLSGNARVILDHVRKARAFGADIVCFPELAVTGYPPEDLLLKEGFIRDNLAALQDVAAEVEDIVAVVGFVDRKGGDLYNAAAVLSAGKVMAVCHKMLLPNYGVFDEKRYFTPGKAPCVFRYGPAVFGVNICEDIWAKEGPTAMQAMRGCTCILNINASPYHMGKVNQRYGVISRQARENKVYIAYTNLVGGQDELVFDGQSMIIGPSGKCIAKAEAFKEDLLLADLAVPKAGKGAATRRAAVIVKEPFGHEKAPFSQKDLPALGPDAEVYQALALGLHDYVSKNNFQKVVVGLSGGVDSALVACLAVDALGKENVNGVFMPSRYSSQESLRDAKELARNLGITLLEVPIDHIYKMYLLTLEEHFAGYPKNIAEENLQARIRGNVLMAFSNKFGWLVLTTGNKSEMSTGYATLYGDMAGGFAVIKDVPKVLVYRLCRYRNSLAAAVIPENVLLKAPTAELKPNQKDSDTLPEYPELDPILKAYVEEDKELRRIVAQGFSRETVSRVIGMVDKSEYKRRQSPPGIKITPKAFGRDRRMPITSRYRPE